MPRSHPARTKMIDGILHRFRRDKWVPIPERWVGQIPHSQTARKQRSHITNHQIRREPKDNSTSRKKGWIDADYRERGPSADEWGD